MNVRKIWSTFLLSAYISVIVAGNEKAHAQSAPQPELIGEGTVSSAGDEYGGSITADGKTIYFSRSVPHSYLYTLCVSHVHKSGHWGKPELLPFSGQWRDSDPVLSPSGDQMLFVSDRPAEGESSMGNRLYRIW